MAGMAGLVFDVVRPYRRWLGMVLLATLLETATNLAGPWPLKIVIDNAIGSHPVPEWMIRLLGPSLVANRMALAAVAALAVVLFAILGSVASYISSYYTESVGQWVANDLRLRVYHHLEQLSLNYYDTHQTGVLLSTITDDVSTIQEFASSAALSILVDAMTIVGMLALMFWLSWDLTLVAIAVMPFMLVFVSRFKNVVKKATHDVRLRQSDIVAVLQQGLESMRVVQAFGREDLEQARLDTASRATVEAALKARRVKSLLSPVVTAIVSLCTV